MEEIIEKNFDKAFAIAWSENQGSYSEDIAKKTLNFVKLQGLRVNSVPDICCGSANFLAEMRVHGKKCTGTEILDSYMFFKSFFATCKGCIWINHKVHFFCKNIWIYQ